MTRVISMDELPFGKIAHRFEGHRYGGVDVSFFVVECPPGGGPVNGFPGSYVQLLAPDLAGASPRYSFSTALRH